MKKIVRHPAAAAEALEAFDWYSSKSRKAAQAFLVDLEHVGGRIAANPRQFPIYEQDIRRAVMSVFPFSVYFRETLFEVQVIAVSHGKREPGYWAGRKF